jgi:hypothetical protein
LESGPRAARTDEECGAKNGIPSSVSITWGGVERGGVTKRHGERGVSTWAFDPRTD